VSGRGNSAPVLSGRTAVVTGGNRGIGRAIALALADAGASVVVGARDADTALDGVDTTGRNIAALRCDVTDDDAMAEFARGVAERHGPPDIVIANSGIAGPTAPLHEITPAEWRECVDVDLTGVYLTFRPFLPAMLERRSGCLLAISSVTGKRPLVGRSPYAAAKLGVIGLIRTLALEVGPYGVRANTVCAGSVNGPRLQRVITESASKRGISEAAARAEHEAPAALQRLVEADEIAATCVFLASDAASAITGEDINVSAGAVMY
jgi:NAD(P)-dependent dehydrogenase (short-subunit alcohol dehydrogenase family)